MIWDVFISHASEDKEEFVKPLAEILSNLRVKVWYDEFTLSIGDSLSKSIDKGLASSRYGIVVISPSFMEKGWTDYELRSLISREIGHEKVILPIWHKITREELIRYSPFLADKFALNTSNSTIEKIAMEILKVVKPEIYNNFMRLLAEEKLRETAKSTTIPLSNININIPPRHEELPTELINRIRIIHKLFYDVLPISLEETINNFRRDYNPSREIKIWEHMAATYLEYLFGKDVDIEYKKEVFEVILLLSIESNEYKKKFKFLTSDDIEKIKELYNSLSLNLRTGILVTSGINENNG